MIEAMINLTFNDCKISCTQPDDFAILNNQSILITGGTGFMGKWLTEMICYINETKAYDIKLHLHGTDIAKFKNEVPHLANKPYVTLIEQDIRNIYELPNSINYIIHAAGSPDNRDHISQPLKTLETFYKGTQALLDAASRLPDLKKIIHISSNQIYGRNDSEEFISENFSGKLEPNSNSVYAESKRVSETLCAIYYNKLKLPLIILRPFAFIGPYQNLDKPWAINNFIRDGILDGPIRILGNGSTIRSYIYASDMAYWILKTFVHGQLGETYNLGSNYAISLDDLAQKIKTAINPLIEILSKSSKTSYTTFSSLVPNNLKIIKHLHLQETHTIDDAIKKTIVWNQLKRKI